MACLVAACVFFWISTFGPAFIQNVGGTLSCGFLKHDDVTGVDWYGGFSDIPIGWWKATIVLHGFGAAILLLSVAGAVVTLFSCFQKHQRSVHNMAISGAVFIFIGLILFCVGFKDMKEDAGAETQVCRICGDATGPFVLEDCKIGNDLIFMIIGVVAIVVGAIMGSCIEYDKRYEA
jgi:hypothetical protein